MEAIFALNAPMIMSFLLTLFRVSIVMFLLPFYSGNFIPIQIKAAVSIIMTLAIWPALSFDGSLFPAHPFGIALVILGEVLLGMLLGMLVEFIFAGIQTGGQILGFQMGFTMIQAADPMSGQQVGATSTLLYYVSMVCFLTMNGHLYLLHALTSSFELIPPGGFLVKPALVREIISLSAGMFIIALKIAAPVMASLFLVELALALMARAAPQMNILMIGMPIKIGVGFFFMTIIFTLIAQMLEGNITSMGASFRNLLLLGSPVGQ